MAFGSGTINNFASAFGDIFAGEEKAAGAHISAEGMRLKAQGDLAEADNYDLASDLARKNQMFAHVSTGIKEMQTARQTYLGIGQERADIAGAGFSVGSGTSLDLLRSAVQQGALMRQVVTEQGQMIEAGYAEQGAAYANMAKAARYAASVESNMANEEDDLGSSMKRHGLITGAIKGIAGIASLFI